MHQRDLCDFKPTKESKSCPHLQRNFDGGEGRGDGDGEGEGEKEGEGGGEDGGEDGSESEGESAAAALTALVAIEFICSEVSVPLLIGGGDEESKRG